MADSLPGLGIVAAVLGVVITMGALGGPPEEIGHKVAAALVGTFLGILLCYGLVGPIAANMTKAAEEEHAFLYVLRVLMVSFLKGTAPIMAVEMARRAVPGHVRPSFQELEKACRKSTMRRRGVSGSSASRGRRSLRLVLIVAASWYGQDSPHHHPQEKRRPRRPSWRRVEGRLRRLRHCHDGAVHRPLAAERQQTSSGSRRRILQRSHRNFEKGRLQHAGSGENFTLTRDNMPKLKEQLQQAMRQMTDFEKLKSHIEMTVTAEGLRIELSESASGTFFDSGSAKLKGDGSEMLITLAQELGTLPNKLSIEGHTDSQPYSSADLRQLGTLRRSRQRRSPRHAGQRNPPDQVTQVRGFADQRLRKPDAPLDPSNRRISLIVQYIVKNNDDEDAKPAAGEGKTEQKQSASVPEKPAAKE